ncbi:CBS domain-containing protein [Streptomyces sp. NBC_00354]|uniref:CBS domain-containing protein n=1 Tax=Streptomyces sp. NBC_00354 TaxID=2975723 RepID=UPI002E25369C
MTSTPYTVHDVMTTPVVTVTPATEFKEIVAAMERWKVSAVAVIEGEARVVGVVSEADLLPKEEFHEHRPGMIEQLRRLGDTAKAGSVRAEQLMTAPAVTVNPGATLPQAARLMADLHIKRGPRRRPDPHGRTPHPLRRRHRRRPLPTRGPRIKRHLELSCHRHSLARQHRLRSRPGPQPDRTARYRRA